MNFKHLFLALFLCAFSYAGNAQVDGGNQPFYYGTISSVEYVTPMSERPEDLLPSDDSVKEAKDKRSEEYESLIIPGKDPQTEDDYFVVNKHKASQSRTATPPSLVFDAYSSGSQPTDPSLAVGPNHVMVVYNTGFTIYDKAGNQLVPQTAPNPAIFPNGGCCDLTVSYDNAADRWVLTFLGNGAQIAVSDGPNPVTAGWYIYNISQISDYQKLSVWSDGYYITDNTGGSNKVWALERSEMLNGNPNAQIIGFNLPGLVTSGFFSPQALNVTDSNLPAPGGATIVYMADDAWSGVSYDHVKFWTIDVDWNNAGNSTISNDIEIATTPFISVFDGGSFSNLTQPNGGIAIDALQATIMNQAQFRKFPTHNSALFNFVVDTDASGGELAGVRWFEFRQNGDNQPWTLYQEGTYTAPDGRHAWHASLAMDANGNIGMGYTSMSGPSTPTTVRVSSYFTGRLAGDPLGTMTVAEELIANGNANIPGLRYGDYSKIDVDPNDGTTFWFINEYMNSGRKGVVGRFQIQQGPPDTQAPTDPTNLVATNITDQGATLNWTASSDNVGVSQYNIFIDGNLVGTSGTNSFVVTGLNPTTTYLAEVNAQDAAGNTSGNASTTFTTLAAPPPMYCSSSSNNASEEYIGRVQLNTIDNTSGGQTYTDFTSISTTLTEGQSYNVTVTPVWPGQTYAEGYAVWIDYNGDFDFDDAGELVWSQAPTTNSPVSGSFTVPAGTVGTSTRMRVSMKYNGIPTPCENFTYGEVEDYTIILTSGGGDTTPPTDPTNLVASNITTSGADLDWTASTDNVGVVQYNIFIDGNLVGTSPTNSFVVTGLAPSTTYTAEVNAEDAAGNTSGNASTTFTTQAQTGFCASSSQDASQEYIRTVRLNTISNNSGATVYSDFTAISTTLDEGQSYLMRIRPRWTGATFAEGYAVWIDYNNNNDFTDPGELVLSIAPTTATAVSGTISVPNGTAGTAVRMRVSMKRGGIPSPCEVFANGEVEDYTIILNGTGGGDTTPPTDPTNLTASNVTSTTVDLSWNASSDNVGVTGYEIFQDGSSIGTVPGTSTTVTGLSPSTTYDFFVQAFDAAGNTSGNSNTVSVTTTAGGGGGPGQIAAYFFETGLEGWSDPGSDCAWVQSGAAFEGVGCVRLRDDSNTSNSESPVLDLTGNTQVTFEFHIFARSMETGEDFFVEFFDGSSYQVIGQYASGTDFTDNSFFSPTPIVLSSGTYNFNANNRFRIRCDASANNDQIFFDQVIISGDNVTLAPQPPVAEPGNTLELRTFAEQTEQNVRIYPNPTNSILNIVMEENNYDEIVIFASSGQIVYVGQPGVDNYTIDVSGFANGMYFIRFVADGIATTKRFIKQ
jgi:chitodextrinase